MSINKSTELAGAGRFPSQRHGQRERKLLQTANSFSPTTGGDWSPSPSTQDSALDQLASRQSDSEASLVTLQSLTTDIDKTYRVTYDAGSDPVTGTIDTGITVPASGLVAECFTVFNTTLTGASNVHIEVDGQNLSTTTLVGGSGVDGNYPLVISSMSANILIQITGTVTAGSFTSYIRVLNP